MAVSGDQPRGRNAVKRALLNAAAKLLAERGPSGVSIRDVAKLAGVNHGLIHRHFGSKQNLVVAVMEDLVQQISQAAASADKPDNVFTATAERSAYWRVLARALLDGESPHSLQGSFPIVQRLVARSERAQAKGHLPPHLDTRLVTAMGVGMTLGWLVFEPFLLAAAGLEDRDKKDLRAQVLTTWLELVRGRRDAR